MSRTTEIYICKPGQKIKQGKLEYDNAITTREAAMADAAIRTKVNPSLAAIAYYSVGKDGDVDPLFLYEGSITSKSTKRSAPAGIPKGSRKKTVRKRSLFRRLRAVFEA